MYCAGGLAAYVGSIVAGYAVGREVRGVAVDWVNGEIVGECTWHSHKANMDISPRKREQRLSLYKVLHGM